MDINAKQKEILLVAEDLFAKNGFDGTSVRDIAQEAGINVAMINYYFGSKEGLLETLVKERADNHKLDPKEYNFETDPFKRLDRMIEHYIETKIANQHIYQILSTEASVKKRVVNSANFIELRKHNINCLAEIVEYGCQQKAFRYYDPILLHTTMIGTFMNFRMNQSIFEELLKTDPEQDFDQFLREGLTKHLKFTIKAILTHEN
ncbi:transcriptional regulator, TetR family [Pseudopedobacter saltans DSM 12145]|uniref:Transcriptional regulator, TetR family n=1 Tax=Pseudopedobacter saltans (strain ATCC 51119 / DSM 12145 / JCM 21818 / CCUG 39354 / LMG 10337 / NBRC 100064 / NCIMB 13643) TaxID=762903 RepID=F0SDY1_PSESL|nr:TetR family transcriptional regulator [Pseudopedobacter saltans]ADY51877.1 transcriptional regulator, TetR family [Pseudopedobacter saltans DSM 12145]